MLIWQNKYIYICLCLCVGGHLRLKRMSFRTSNNPFICIRRLYITDLLSIPNNRVIHYLIFVQVPRDRLNIYNKPNTCSKAALSFNGLHYLFYDDKEVDLCCLEYSHITIKILLTTPDKVIRSGMGEKITNPKT